MIFCKIDRWLRGQTLIKLIIVLFVNWNGFLSESIEIFQINTKSSIIVGCLTQLEFYTY